MLLLWLLPAAGFVTAQAQAPPYTFIGCWKHWSPAPMNLITTGTTSIETCYQLALFRKFNIFAVQNAGSGSCWGANDTVPGGNYAQYGVATFGCTPIGTSMVNAVYQINPTLLSRRLDYTNLGCWNDSATSAALDLQEGQGYALLDATPATRVNPIQKCYQLAGSLGHNTFALQSGACYTKNDTTQSYSKYGFATMCPTNGTGATLTNHVYQVNIPPAPGPYQSLGCWNEGRTGEFSALRYTTLIPSNSTDPRATCFSTAASSGLEFNIFALQQVPNNSTVLECSWAKDIFANGTYSFYGPSTACSPSGIGGTNANHVYRPLSGANLVRNPQVSGYTSFGCFKSLRAGLASSILLNTTTFNTDVQFCADYAREFGYPYFQISTLSSAQFQCGVGYDFVPGGFHTVGGSAEFCRTDGLGEIGVNNVYIINSNQVKALRMHDLNFPTLGSTFFSEGCYIYNVTNPAYSFRGQDPAYTPLAGSTWQYSSGFSNASTPSDPVSCYNLAAARRHNIFALVNNRFCFTTADSFPGIRYKGDAEIKCPSHFVTERINGNFATGSTSQVFKITSARNTLLNSTSPDWSHIACISYQTTMGPGAATVASTSLGTSRDAIGDCYRLAVAAGVTRFLMRGGGQCVVGNSDGLFIQATSTGCFDDRRGAGRFVNRRDEASGTAIVNVQTAPANLFQVESTFVPPTQAITGTQSQDYLLLVLPGAGRILSVTEVVVQSTSSKSINRLHANASSIYGAAGPSLAINGVINGNWAAGDVTHTAAAGETNPWLRVYLSGDIANLGSVIVYGRTGTVADRIQGLRVYLVSGTTIVQALNLVGINDTLQQYTFQ